MLKKLTRVLRGFKNPGVLCGAARTFSISLAIVGMLLLFTRWARFGRVLRLCCACADCGPRHAAGRLLADGRTGEQVSGDGARSQGAPTGFIILGGAVDPELSRDRGSTAIGLGAERLTVVAKLAREYPSAKFIYASGSAALLGGLAEADYVLPLFESFGIDRSRIILENRSRNTAENAEFSKAIANPKPGERWVVDYLGGAYAARHGRVPCGRLQRRGLSGRLADPTDGRPGDKVVRARARRYRRRGARVHRPVSLLAHRTIVGTVSRPALAMQHRAVGVGRKLAPPHHDHRCECAQYQCDRADEPAEIAERKKERPLAAVELQSGTLEQSAWSAGRGLRSPACPSPSPGGIAP